MRLDRLSVALRPRTPWEAMDLGQALVRRHAGAVWRAWFMATLPVFVLVNALAWLAGSLWLAALAMWWLKPLFERVPLYVLSRAVFGEVPGAWQAVRAAQVRQWGQVAAWLTWRRLHPARALVLPVDVLESPRGPARGARVRVLQQAIQSPAWGLTIVGLGLEAALFVSVWALALMLFVPTIEAMSDSARAMFDMFFADPPGWAQLVTNAVLWAATSAVEPMAVGAGFGLYLNRRTQLEAWDVELSFRRLAERVRELGQALALVAMLAVPAFAAWPVDAQAAAVPTAAAKAGDADENEGVEAEDKSPPIRAPEMFGPAWRAPDPAFGDSVEKAYADPLLAPKKTVEKWVRRHPPGKRPSDRKSWQMPSWLQGIGAVIAGIGEYGLWAVAGLLLAFVLWKLPRWLPWVRDLVPAREAPTPIVEHDDPVAAPLPSDLPAAVRRLWHGGRHREALALLYRASVERLADTLGVPLPPGATEAECLRRARRLPDADGRARFADVVRSWQAAAYAHRLPDAEAFDRLVEGWTRGFGGRP